ncbi:RusA family crossover junction endodeoxyribonuclease [Thermoactinomyces sp. Gus2-1]|uniref:RusA family crossover junction endodeoxyribonuclease n=1 Tax=unclassified Thermoactinomyces TaxID=2634588 RepID=UPI000508ABE1|nr:RusA family crossover junction endodeoxyribonuclease [Thermoactinomyces sp. Gus2-1]KFZ39312.1 hypothetical protein JS81_15085 [Thermoactinomyces sp. Gus2-1]MBH8582480.1 RusA family crossover junction endodeoxyribonuclease [Thermoactinomyces sp. CICC 10735]
MRIVVPGRPIPYKRMTQRGKFVKRDAQRYLGYKDYVRLCATRAMANAKMKMIKRGIPIEFGCRVYLKGSLDGDLSNYVKSLEDALNLVVFEDDRWIVRYLYAEKVFVKTKDEERAEIEAREVKVKKHSEKILVDRKRWEELQELERQVKHLLEKMKKGLSS